MEWVDGHQDVTNVGVNNAFQVPLLKLSRDDILKNHTHTHRGIKMEEYFMLSNLRLFANSGPATSSIYSSVVKSLTTTFCWSCLPRLNDITSVT